MRDDTLSELAVLKQDARDFGWRQMEGERDKRGSLEALYLAVVPAAWYLIHRRRVRGLPVA